MIDLLNPERSVSFSGSLIRHNIIIISIQYLLEKFHVPGEKEGFTQGSYFEMMNQMMPGQ